MTRLHLQKHLVCRRSGGWNMIRQKPTTSVDRVVVPLVAIVLTSRTGHDRWFQLNTRRSGRGVRSLVIPKLLKLSSSWIIPLSKWLVTESTNISHSGHLEGKQPYLGDLPAMVINHLLIGMILQVQMCKSVGKPIVGHVGPEDGNIFFVLINQPLPNLPSSPEILVRSY